MRERQLKGMFVQILAALAPVPLLVGAQACGGASGLSLGKPVLRETPEAEAPARAGAARGWEAAQE